MNNRHQRRRFRHEATHATLTTFLCEPTDPALATVPLLQRASRHWLDMLAVRVRHCIVCNVWIVGEQDVGALLMSMPDIAKPVSVGSAAICRSCWSSDLPLDALERACATVLSTVVPNGSFEPMDMRR